MVMVTSWVSVPPLPSSTVIVNTTVIGLAGRKEVEVRVSAIV